MKNIKVHAIVLALIIIAEMIGNVSFKIGVGTIVLLPMLYALIMGIFMAPKFLKVVNQKDMLDASSLIGITLMLLMARYGTLVGPTLPKILAASPALILQEFGNLGTVFIGVPVAIYLGLKRETIGAAHSIAREPNVALIGERYGLDSAEGPELWECILPVRFLGLFSLVLWPVLQLRTCPSILMRWQWQPASALPV